MLALSGNNYQILAQQDSTKLTLSELKQTAQLLVELEKRRDQVELFKFKENMYQNMIQNFQANERFYEEKIKNLEIYAEAVKPAWYDKFWIGALVAGTGAGVIYILSK